MGHPIIKQTNFIVTKKFQLRDDFQETMEMSTYLVAFVICDYTHMSNITERGISLSVYTPPTYFKQAAFALTTASHIMDFLDEFFGISYPLPKQDLIAIPDTASGAMENWGLFDFKFIQIGLKIFFAKLVPIATCSAYTVENFVFVCFLL